MVSASTCTSGALRTRIAAPKKYHGYLRRLAAKDVGALEPDGDDDALEPDDEGTL